MEQLTQEEILKSAPIAEQDEVTTHFTDFVNNFVQKNRRDRWLHLLLKRPKQVFNDSHKLHGHLSSTKCSLLKDEKQINPKSKGIYYDFLDEPIVLTFAEALVISQGKDAIFSVIPGELAIYFFHEDESVLCRGQF